MYNSSPTAKYCLYDLLVGAKTKQEGVHLSDRRLPEIGLPQSYRAHLVMETPERSLPELTLCNHELL